MPIVPYVPERFESVCAFGMRVGVPLLTHQSFLDHYYASRDWCKLYLFLNENSEVVGTVGVERLRFEQDGNEMIAAVGSNFHVSQHGSGGYLFLQWARTCTFALEYGGSEDAHRIIRQQKWSYFNGIRTYVLNHDYPVYPANSPLQAAAKWVLRHTRRKRIPAYVSRLPRECSPGISVREERSYSADLLPAQSPFAFRLAPSVDYLQWRYNLALSFVRYRLFRILAGKQTVGYVILSDFPDRVIVAQSDGTDAGALAFGTLLSILQLGAQDRTPRLVLLNSAHHEMQRIYTQFGFIPHREEFLFAMGSRKPIDIPSDTSHWLINYDWCDNGLFASVPGRVSAEVSCASV